MPKYVAFRVLRFYSHFFSTAGPARERSGLNHRFTDVFQEDLSRLRRKLEKQKKVEMYTDADEILQEEINQYKVREKVESYIIFIHILVIYFHIMVEKKLEIHH